MITNGDFSDGSNLWAIVSGTGTIDVTDGQLCVAVGAGSQVSLAWPQPAGTTGADLTRGTSYTLSYDARTTHSAAGIVATIASNRTANAAADFQSGTDTANTTTKAFTHTFSQGKDDPSAGLTFMITSNDAQSVCFADVSLVSN